MAMIIDPDKFPEETPSLVLRKTIHLFSDKGWVVYNIDVSIPWADGRRQHE
jgi:hypothetical protein